MTRLKRVLTLLDRYDDLAAAGVSSHPTSEFGKLLLKELREEKEKLTQELTEHGCRRER
jgi:hypothetical protein